jgi:hypothetical protein
MSISDPSIPQRIIYDDVLNSMSAISQHLDACYLKLWDPRNPLNPDCDDAREDKQVEEAHALFDTRDPTTAGRCQQMLVSSPTLSAFNAFQLKIMLYAIDGTVTGLAKPDRINMLSEIRYHLATLKTEPKSIGGCPSWWLQPLQEWIDNVSTVLDTLSPKKRERDNQDNDDERPATRPRIE